MKLFEILFDLDNGYIYKNNIFKLPTIKFREYFDYNKLAFILDNLDEVKNLYRKDARDEVALDKYYFKSKTRKRKCIYYANICRFNIKFI